VQCAYARPDGAVRSLPTVGRTEGIGRRRPSLPYLRARSTIPSSRLQICAIGCYGITDTKERSPVSRQVLTASAKPVPLGPVEPRAYPKLAGWGPGLPKLRWRKIRAHEYLPVGVIDPTYHLRIELAVQRRDARSRSEL
jgi:hypothetical protein